jgi:hypothetical protein
MIERASHLNREVLWHVGKLSKALHDLHDSSFGEIGQFAKLAAAYEKTAASIAGVGPFRLQVRQSFHADVTKLG